MVKVGFLCSPASIYHGCGLQFNAVQLYALCECVIYCDTTDMHAEITTYMMLHTTYCLSTTVLLLYYIMLQYKESIDIYIIHEFNECFINFVIHIHILILILSIILIYVFLSKFKFLSNILLWHTDDSSLLLSRKCFLQPHTISSDMCIYTSVIHVYIVYT